MFSVPKYKAPSSLCVATFWHFSHYVSFSELSDHISVYPTWASDVSLSNLPGAKRQGGLWVSSHLWGAWALLWVSAGQPAGRQHLPQCCQICVHRGSQEKQRQPGDSYTVPPHMGPHGWGEALHLHMQGLPGRQLEGKQHGRAPQWVAFAHSNCHSDQN